MTESDQKELLELRAFKRAQGSPFERLELALHSPHTQRCDAVMSVHTFKLLGECILELKRRMGDE